MCTCVLEYSKAKVCRSGWPRGIRRGSAVPCLLGMWVRMKPGGGMDVCLLWVSCVVRSRAVRRADHSSRGVLPRVVCLSVIEEPPSGGLGLQRLSSHEKRNSVGLVWSLFRIGYIPSTRPPSTVPSPPKRRENNLGRSVKVSACKRAPVLDGEKFAVMAVCRGTIGRFSCVQRHPPR